MKEAKGLHSRAPLIGINHLEDILLRLVSAESMISRNRIFGHRLNVSGGHSSLILKPDILPIRNSAQLG
jgi:tRNA A37 threonylcarbamoyltransferase TsaD